jgi:HlyD family secretion protein
MFGRDRQIFRSKALERVSSPDHLDQLIEIVNPKDWLPLVVLGSLIALTIVWGVVAKVPTTVSSRGILIHPRRILELQTLGSGRLETVRIKPGDSVKSGDIIGRLDQYEIRRRLDEERATLAELQLQDRAKATIQSDQFRKQQERR